MTEFTIRSESNPPFHLDIKSWPDSVIQLCVVADGITHKWLGAADEPDAHLALQLNPEQIRELVDHLEPFATQREREIFGETSDLCGKGEWECAPKCCQSYVGEDEVGLLAAAVPPTMEPLRVLDESDVTHTYAESKLIFAEEPQETILQEAQRIVHGPRRAAYGHPSRNFGRIAGLWQGYLDGMDHDKLDATDVAMLMVLLKVARIQHKPDRDGVTDICGYAACAAIINEIDPS